jgi:hypothetical protein
MQVQTKQDTMYTANKRSQVAATSTVHMEARSLRCPEYTEVAAASAVSALLQEQEQEVTEESGLMSQESIYMDVGGWEPRSSWQSRPPRSWFFELPESWNRPIRSERIQFGTVFEFSRPSDRLRELRDR